MVSEWNLLSEDLQFTLSREALRLAAQTMAGQAEILAGEMETGTLADRGGPEALRLLAAIMRATGTETPGPVGRA